MNDYLTIFRWDSFGTHDLQLGGAEGPTYYPGFETWFWLLLVTAVVAFFLVYLVLTTA